jgi:uncharacterized membrane protein
LLGEAFDQIRQNAEGNVAVLRRQLEALETIAGQTSNGRRRDALRQQAELISDVAERTISSKHDCVGINDCLARLTPVLAGR